VKSIIGLKKEVSKLNPTNKKLFNRFFSVTETVGRLKAPKSMFGYIEKNFGSIKKVEKQKIVKTFNKLSFEGALFNELRANRPIEAKTTVDIHKLIDKNLGDPFCKPLKMTPADVFGRIKGKKCITASNFAKYDGWHGLVVFDKHNPLKVNKAEILDYLNTAELWIKKVHCRDKQANYPFILWNCLWKAAGSIIHGHLQLIVTKQQHYSKIESLRKVWTDYSKEYNSDYFEDLFKAHKSLGLGVKKGKLMIFSSITPVKEKESWIVSEKFNSAHKETIAGTILSFLKMGVSSFNLGSVFPPLDKQEKWTKFPVVTRILDRGQLSNKTSDIGGMELYGANVVASDPYKVFKKIKSSL